MNIKSLLKRAANRSSRIRVMKQLLEFSNKNPYYKNKVQHYRRILNSSFGAGFENINISSPAVKKFMSEPIKKPTPIRRSSTDELTDWRNIKNPYISHEIEKRTPREFITLEAHNEFWEKKYIDWRKNRPYPIEWPSGWKQWWEPTSHTEKKYYKTENNADKIGRAAEKKMHSDLANFKL